MDSFDRFEEMVTSKNILYSKLNDEYISDSDYEYAKTLWKTFKCKTIGDYHDVYLRTDVLILANVFENFRKACMEYYNLDPVHYFSSPGFSWDAMLKKTGANLELITDIDIYLMVEKGLRGGF